MTFHHVGCAVRDMNESVVRYGAMLSGRRRSRVLEVASQSARVCFLELGPDSYLELVEGTSDDSPVARFYPTGFYHLCFLVDDLSAAVSAIPRPSVAMPSFRSEAFDGSVAQFVMTGERHLIELVEMQRDAFASFFESCLAG